MLLSEYQQQIIEWVKSGKGNGCCNAVAGSGKSTTLKLVALALQESGVKPSEIKVIVFGKANSLDLISKFGNDWKESISTLHSAGFSLLKQELLGSRNSQKKVNVVSTKYKKIAQEKGYIDYRKQKGDLKRFDAIASDSDFLKLIDLVRLTNVSPATENIKDICKHFEIPDVWGFSEVADAIDKCLIIGESKAKNQNTFDFTDQIWLPVKWQLGKRKWFHPYKFVLVDEAQDLNAAQLELSLALAGKTGRILAVADPHQAIMGFAGADNDSYYKIVERTSATELPLSICYRCPRSHIKLVNELYSHIKIEPHENAVSGTIEQIKDQELNKYLQEGDLILSRKTAPLVSLCIKLIAKGISATVKGRAIGEQIKNELQEISKLPGFHYENFHESVNVYRNIKLQKYKNLDNEEQLIENLNDKLEAITVIYNSNTSATCITHLEIYIDDLFSDEHSPITLSTCHRAKGLEGDRIFIIKPDDMPMTWRNQQDWQKKQENNLLYVALTRSKQKHHWKHPMKY
jgi:DNA helicase II / ATP-dependent DNA helicase PcrA